MTDSDKHSERAGLVLALAGVGEALKIMPDTSEWTPFLREIRTLWTARIDSAQGRFPEPGQSIDQAA